jgi:hypothetical protein
MRPWMFESPVRVPGVCGTWKEHGQVVHGSVGVRFSVGRDQSGVPGAAL